LLKSNNLFYKELETLFPDNINRVFKGKAKKALLKGNNPSRKELEIFLPDNID
jgi:hypothetical protein